MEQEIRTLQYEMTTIEATLSELRRSQDRHDRVVYWALGAVFTIFGALLIYNNWNVTRAYNDLSNKVAALWDFLSKPENAIEIGPVTT
jgi:hypothetical protein